MKRLIGLIIVAAISMMTLSSCLLLENEGYSFLGEGKKEINVDGGDNYENININAGANANQLAANKAVLSAVSIETTHTGVSGVAFGSGVIYKLDKAKGDAYIITNYHLVYNADSTVNNGISTNVKIYLYGMEYNIAAENIDYGIEATYIGGSMYYDIAVLKVSGNEILMASDARAADIADSHDVSVLDTAIAIGNAKGEGLSATVGVVNVDSEYTTIDLGTSRNPKYTTVRVMRIDTAVNGGNSGGGVFNSNGELIGIVNSKLTIDGIENMGFAIPSNIAVAIAENAMHYRDGSVYRCMLGVTVGVIDYSAKYDTETGKVYKYETVVVDEVEKDKGAYGYLEVGDIINSITVDGKTQKITRFYQVSEAMLNARVESRVTINVTRGEKTMNIEIPITKSMLTEWRVVE